MHDFPFSALEGRRFSVSGRRPGPWLGMPWKFISEELRPAGVPFGLAPSYNLHAGPAANSVVAQGADEAGYVLKIERMSNFEGANMRFDPTAFLPSFSGDILPVYCAINTYK